MAREDVEMARGRKRKSIDESSLSKMQLRKLNALRKSVGDEIAERAFIQWLDTVHEPGDSMGSSARTITEALHPLIDAGKLRIPRGGFILRRGRGRVIIERPEAA